MTALEECKDVYQKRQFASQAWSRLSPMAGKIDFTALRKMIIPSGHITASEIKRRLGASKWQDLYTFTFVRNPWDWQLSQYSYIRSATHDYNHKLCASFTCFDEYIDWRCQPGNYTLQTDFVTDEREGTTILKDIHRFERLRKDFEIVCQTIGRKFELPHLNKSMHEHYRQVYTRWARERVRKCFEKDIESFGYQF